MLSLFVIWVSAFFKDWLQLHRAIGGRWHIYLWNLWTLKRYKRAHPKGRLQLHDIWNAEEQCHMGMYAFPQETTYCNPKKDKGEDLFIYGSNTGEKTTIEVYFKRRPLPQTSGRFDSPQDLVEVNMRLDDGKGNLYSLEEKEVRQFSPIEYRAAGFAFESLQANKTARIKFRGYLKKNGEEKLYYVQIRFLCLFFSNVYDHQHSFNEYYLARELSNKRIDSVEELLEDKFEQFCQIKGTFKVESEEESELFFLSTVGRRFLPKKALLPRRAIKLFGFDKDGHGFQLGLVEHGDIKYRYGFTSFYGDRFRPIEHLSLTHEVIERLSKLTPFIDSYEFEVKFAEDKKMHKFVVRRHEENVKRLKLDGVEGMCFIDDREFAETEELTASRDDKSFEDELANTLVVPLAKDSAQLVELTGGKGASLAQLKQLSNGNDWSVPNALIVTTSAFKIQTQAMEFFENKLEQLQRHVVARTDVAKECEKMVAWFSTHELSTKIRKVIELQMASEFGNEWQQKLFAVRSSAAGEDSSEMSAAGQMTTYLGIRGGDNLCSAVLKCWASQFAFIPIEYKRGYGQELNSPMAVVIQEMVDCDSAGVIFTANPTDGDERILTLTSNFGLGESVVSASAEPDTFQLSVKVDANSYEAERTIESIISKTLGKKSLITRLNKDLKDIDDLDDFVLNEPIQDGAQQQSVADEQVLQLGNIALQIQKHYGNARDIEWGIKNAKIYLFQSRPITNLDSNFTNYELIHELDTPHMSEFEIYSRAHWGENYPGATSWVGAYTFLNSSGWTKNQIRQGALTEKDYNPFKPGFAFMNNQLMFGLKSGPFEFLFRDYPESDFSSAQVLAFFGHHITDPDVLEAIKFLRVTSKPMPTITKIILPFFMGYHLIFISRNVKKLNRRIFGEEGLGEIVSELKKVPLKDKLRYLLKGVDHSFSYMHIHGMASMGSTTKNMILLKTLTKSAVNEQQAERDYNLLMSSCNDVVSAEVPNNLKAIANSINDKATFVSLSDEEALKVLRNNNGTESSAALLFVDFLKRHGHRGYREFDPLHLPWGKNPIPCVQVIKSLLKSGTNLESKREKPIEELLAQMQTQLGWFKRLLVSKWLLPWCRNAVGYREHTKSIFVKLQDHLRDAYIYLGEEMVAAGLLPEADLIFYLKTDETQRLITGERNPLLAMKAKQRKRLYPFMNKPKFDEFVKGFRMAPRAPKKEIIQLDSDSICLKGTAVTVGDIKARVCVAETIEEADNIQQGDILLTYSTDIGWSPYFPLISGIVTEIGGTISHGAVIAREFGIPCLIAVEDVCSHFKTGDIAYLDTKTATIVKLKA